MPLFVSSAVTPAVQLADVFAGIVRHYYENKLDGNSPETEFQKIGTNFSYPVTEKTIALKEDNFYYYACVVPSWSCVGLDI